MSTHTNIQAIILAGGIGKRLKSITGDAIPKPMVIINGQPFLAHYLTWLASQNITKACLAVSYKAEVIEDYFGDTYQGVELCYSHEATPLGTGGAIKQALSYMQADQPCFVSNGDSFMQLDIAHMLKQHQTKQAKLTVALTQAKNCNNGGQAIVDPATSTITEFCYPGKSEPGYISMGAYIIQPDVFDTMDLPERFSFEADVKHPHCNTLKPLAYLYKGEFLDIGTPERYNKALSLTH